MDLRGTNRGRVNFRKGDGLDAGERRGGGRDPYDLEKGPPPPHEDSIEYWSTDDRWKELGRRCQADAIEARRLGVPVETLPGASVRLQVLRTLRKRLDRHAR